MRTPLNLLLALLCFSTPVYASVDAGETVIMETADGGLTMLPIMGDPVVITALPVAAEFSDGDAALHTAQHVYNGLITGNWWVVAVGLVILLVIGLRLFGGRIHPKVKAFLDLPLVGWLLPTVVATLGAILTALAAHQPVGVALMTGLKVAMAAVWAYVGYRKLLETRAEVRAEVKAEITDTGKALNAITGDLK